MKNITGEYCTPIQLKLPLDILKIIPVTDPVYSFSEVMDHIDLSKYFAEKGYKMPGRPRCDPVKLLKIILFAFMEGGYTSVRELEKRCNTDIRYMWLLDGMEAPSFMTFQNFIHNELSGNIEAFFLEINSSIFEKEGVDLQHIYIDGTKLEANANKYSWVWKKSCIRNRTKVFARITDLLERINNDILFIYGVKMEPREEYKIEYVEYLLETYLEITGFNPASFVKGVGHRKSKEQKQYEELEGYLNRLKKYAEQIDICGDERNSYSKSDRSATFFRMKGDYMGNDQLLPGYNMQVGICDEYIAVADVKQYASDMDCFVPLMEKFHGLYGIYPEYPVADAGYGSYNNYLYCEEHGMQKYMKFTMYEKTVDDKRFREDPYRAVNFRRDKNGNLLCPNGRAFHFKKSVPVIGNKYGRTEEIYECESCEGCPCRQQCFKSRKGNRTVRLNRELTSFHAEVLENLESTKGALLRMNRSIQAEGTYGIIKWNHSYKRVYRRGLESVILEFMMICCGFNLKKFHNKKIRKALEQRETA